MTCLAIGMLAMAIFDTVLSGLRGMLLSHTTNRMDVELGARLFDHLFTLPLTWFESRPAGAVAARVKELDSVRALLTGPALTAALDVVFTLVFIAVMWSFSPALTGIVLATVAGFALVHLALAPVLKSGLADRFSRGADAQAFLVEAVTGIETLKMAAAEPHLRRRWQELLVASTRAAFRATVASEATGHAVGFLNKLMTVAILWYGARLVMDQTITAGTLIAFNMMGSRVTGPVLRLTQGWQQVQQGRVALQRLGDVLGAQTEPGAVPGRTPLGRIEGRVALRGVVFRYGPRSPAALDGIGFSVPPGQVVGIVGPSGSGKSTLTKLLQRLYVPERGVVSVDGVDSRRSIPPGCAARSAWCCRRTCCSTARSATTSRCADPALPHGRGHRGGKAGRRARVHHRTAEAATTRRSRSAAPTSPAASASAWRIARALVTEPRILILDEATSALDYRKRSHHPPEHAADMRAAAPCSSSPTVSPPCGPPTVSWCWNADG